MKLFQIVQPDQVVTNAGQMQEIALGLKHRELSIGLVPTMGYLHQGHLSLVQRARSECDRAVMSIFVNPLQFGPQEDFAAYPRDPDRDLALAREEGVDFVFAPTGDSMYPDGFNANVEVGGILTEKLCARSRPGHFRGVTTGYSNYSGTAPSVSVLFRYKRLALNYVQRYKRHPPPPAPVWPLPFPSGLLSSIQLGLGFSGFNWL